MQAALYANQVRTAPPPASDVAASPPPFIREAVRALLLASPAYLELDQDRRRQLASSMVRVCSLAAALIQEEIDSDDTIQATHTESPTSALLAQTQQHNPGRPLAQAQAEFGGAASRVAGTTRAVLNAVSFPRFVTELINGVFKAMIDSSMQQMQSYVELLNNVAASVEGFADSNMGPDRARAWLVERYPSSFELSGADEEEVDPEELAEQTVRLRPGANMPSEAALRADLGLEENESVPAGDPDRALVPLARRRLAKMRQEMLATMVMLGMQRIVVESGRIQAAMRFHIDTRDAANSESGSTFNFQNQVDASGRFGVGPWGVSASMSNTIGYVSTQRSQNTQELNTDLELTSSVEINFKSDYVPLNRLASPGQADRIRAQSRNPDEEFQAARQAEQQRRQSQYQDEAARRQGRDQALMPQPPRPRPAADAQPTSPSQPNQPASGTPPANRPASGTPPANRPTSNAPSTNRPASGTPPANRPASGTPPATRSNSPAASAPPQQTAPAQP